MALLDRMTRTAGGRGDAAPDDTAALTARVAELEAELELERIQHARAKDVLHDALGRAEAAEFELGQELAVLELTRAFCLPSLGYSVPEPADEPLDAVIYEGLRADLTAGDPFAAAPASAFGTGELVPVEVAA